MTFSSIPFLFYFLPLFIGLYFALPARNLTLLIGSLRHFVDTALYLYVPAADC